LCEVVGLESFGLVECEELQRLFWGRSSAVAMAAAEGRVRSKAGLTLVRTVAIKRTPTPKGAKHARIIELRKVLGF
jgi:hypothetical protein